jgi:hypothetical protein
LRARHNLAAVGRNVNTRDSLVVASQLVLQLELTAAALVELDVVVAGYGEGLAVGGEGVVRDGMVEEVVHFWRGHGDRNMFWAIGGALYYCTLSSDCELEQRWSRREIQGSGGAAVIER